MTVPAIGLPDWIDVDKLAAVAAVLGQAPRVRRELLDAPANPAAN